MMSLSGVLWGGAVSPDTAYFGLSGEGGLAALRIKDGKVLWLNKLGVANGLRVSNGAATTAIPGIVFVGDSNGVLKAASATHGNVLWSFDTKREFDAINRVPTHGGSITAPGAVIAGGMVFVGSGYAVLGGSPGNVILAFAASVQHAMHLEQGHRFVAVAAHGAGFEHGVVFASLVTSTFGCPRK